MKGLMFTAALLGVLQAFLPPSSHLPGGPLLPGEAQAAPGTAASWKEEFEDICSRTTVSQSLAPEELRALIARCDLLRPRIEALDDTEKRVYLRKLKMCRDLYQFVLDSKEQRPASTPVPR